LLKSRAPPADAARPDDAAVEDVYRQVESTGSLEAAAKKLQQVAKMRTRMWEDDPEEAEYVAQHQQQQQQHQAQYGYGDEDEDEIAVEDDEEEMQEVVHLQEVVEGLWVGDLVAAMDTEGLEERGIVSCRSSLLSEVLIWTPQSLTLLLLLPSAIFFPSCDPA
jgi:dual specificity phosphatase 12